MIRYFVIFLISLNLLSSNENIVKTSELELVFFKMAYESLLNDVKKSKDNASINENDLKNINKKIEVIMNELFKDKRVLFSEVDENNTLDLKKIQEFKKEIGLLKKELFQIKKKRREYKEKLNKKANNLEEKVIENPSIMLIKKDFKKLYNTEKFKALKCFDYDEGSVNLTISCKDKIKSFINENKNALRYELIPIVSNADNTIFNKIKLLINDLEKEALEKTNTYLKEGLSRHRVIEALKYVNSLNDKLIVTTANYYVKSKNIKGIVLRAYYVNAK